MGDNGTSRARVRLTGTSRRRKRVSAAAVLLTVGAIATACTTSHTVPRPRAAAPTAIAAPGAGPQQIASLGVPGARRPNIVFVLTDDLSTALVPYMPHVAALERAGMQFSNYTVADSLCCPSRSSILTGRFPHNTGVFTNSGPDGGFLEFQRRNDAAATFATALHAAGYRTAMMGKYLNGYQPRTKYLADGLPAPKGSDVGSTYVAPGWSTWDVAGDGYTESNYYLNQNGVPHYYGFAPQDFGVTVLDRLGRGFIHTSARAKKPFLLEIATFAPHQPYAAAPPDRHSFPGLRAPRTPAFNRLPLHAPHWMTGRPPLTSAQVAQTDAVFREQVQAVQSVDRMIGHLQQQLAADGQLGNTVFVFSSDNGLHLGQYTFMPGKLLAFDTDVRVPLVISGPGIPAGSVNDAVVQNVDLAPTFENIAGVTPPASVDGRSLVPLLEARRPGASPVPWRTAALIEHHGLDFLPRISDPDFQEPVQGGPPTYEALRTATFTYVRYDDGEMEYYDRVRDPYELDNLAGTLSASRIADLDLELDGLDTCGGSQQCWTAGHPTGQS